MPPRILIPRPIHISRPLFHRSRPQNRRHLTTSQPHASILGLGDSWYDPKHEARHINDPLRFPIPFPRGPTPLQLAKRRHQARLNPNRIKVYPSLVPSARARCKAPLDTITSHQLTVLDPTGARQKLFDKRNNEGAKVGDILLVRTREGEPFAGVCINIRRRGVDTGILLRDQATRVGVEMWFKVFSPNVEGVEVVQRKARRARRARLYYMRYVVLIVYLLACVLTASLGNRSTIWALCRMWCSSISGRDRHCGLDLRREGEMRIRTRRRRSGVHEDATWARIPSYISLEPNCTVARESASHMIRTLRHALFSRFIHYSLYGWSVR